MAQIETWFKQDLKKAVQVKYINGNLFSQDNQGNIVGVEVFDNGEPVTLSGTVSGNFIRADGGTVAIIGAFEGNKAYVVIPQSAYAVQGTFALAVKLTDDSVVTTLLAVAGTVYRSSTDTIVDPGTVMPSIETLIAQIEAAVESIPADYSDLWESLAPVYSTSATYAIGDFVLYDGVLYRCIKTISEGESWTAAHWKAFTIGGGISINNAEILNAKRSADYAKAIIGENCFEFKTVSTASMNSVDFTTAADGSITIDGTASSNAVVFLTPDGGITRDANAARVFPLGKGITYRLRWHNVSGSVTGGTSVPMVRAVEQGNTSNYVITASLAFPDRDEYYTPSEDINVILAVYAINSRAFSDYVIKPEFSVNVEMQDALDNLGTLYDFMYESLAAKDVNKIQIRMEGTIDTGDVTFATSNDGTVTLNGTPGTSAHYYVSKDYGLGNFYNARIYHLMGGVAYNFGCPVVSGEYSGTTSGVALMRIIDANTLEQLAQQSLSQTYKWMQFTPDDDVEAVIAIYAIEDRTYTDFKITPTFFVDDSDIEITPSIFQTIGVIGDSFASGISSDEGTRYAFSWLQMMAREYGCIGNNFSKGGLTTRTWLTAEEGLAKLQASDPCDAYFVALGINDSNPDERNVPLGTIADMDGSEPPDTFYGNMKRIHDAVVTKNPHACLIYITPMRNRERYTPYQDAVVAIAQKYGCLLVDWRDVSFADTDWWHSNLVDLHPRVHMYNAMMNAIVKLLSKSIVKNMAYMAPYPDIVNT